MHLFNISKLTSHRPRDCDEYLNSILLLKTSFSLTDSPSSNSVPTCRRLSHLYQPKLLLELLPSKDYKYYKRLFLNGSFCLSVMLIFFKLYMASFFALRVVSFLFSAYLWTESTDRRLSCPRDMIMEICQKLHHKNPLCFLNRPDDISKYRARECPHGLLDA